MTKTRNKLKTTSLLLSLILLIGLFTAFPLAADAAGETVYVSGVHLSAGQYLAVGASTATETKPTGGYAYFYLDMENENAPTLELNAYSSVGVGYHGAAIYWNNESTLSLVLTGESTLVGPDCNTDRATGIYVGLEICPFPVQDTSM